MGKISVVINTRNEEENLPRAIASIKNFAGEIVVVDMESTDRTVEIAKKAGAKVYSHKPTGIVEPARNFAIKKAKGDWILILDADEEITKELADKLKEIVSDENSADYYRIPRKNIIFGKWIKHARWWPDYNTRFFKKGKVVWSEIIHSVPETHGKGLDLQDSEDIALLHNNYKSIDQYISRMNVYTSEQAKLVNKDYTFLWSDLIKKPVGEFLSRYFAGQGYKDGVHGLVLCMLQAFSEFVLYLKVWQAQKFEEQSVKLPDLVSAVKDVGSELHYWQADALVRESGGILQRVKRKFKLA
ncbi:MAG: hypothetical protein A3D24_01700 [Candidatus Blackburnbacteria bacterium RIFCSPHIGHO2_02_FULL_39_13]|uniref:Glycosyltransferase 2-like domain-containing protein n=1 Tax=Candidatus Blackburnbacteria bacterium RIFCSPLOWO2_01_FULL_40_20 TaxID=1797519 RepID=A0A1G1VCB2_9BACT|nr:MAG: hypothetical protein A2694_00750 [Candidatus Blackburnbacteria bacterium RIFCSPHIGHO2_01_FULL_40_17]OGY07934.1 MAG: hypothetical protein A3D24_01700 [Candidatus Blackburnbacteria bacterium RIFCSPHIGHO2_02_FULL_39_13]OGY12991.1 MAG: hypothetical protein A3A77_01605 [Candidatus Blackburnbacteria bacterium RIFCSPLOWO2_01_FULL_40_20]HBL51760.1 glycosyltransferase family 2 protein [Candidatus Blackburnbacteria bacterium]